MVPRMDARFLGFLLLQGVFEQRRPLEEALEALPAADPRDRAAAHRLAATVLRRAGTLDAVLEPHLRRAPPEPVRQVLRLGAAGLLLLGTPAHAAVATAVGLARDAKLTPFAGLVNAVLRRVAEQGPALLDALDTPRLDTPAWLWASWGGEARAIAEAHQQEAPLDLTLAPGEAPPPGGAALPNGSVRFPAGTRVTEIEGFERGAFWVQDAAASMPARLLAPLPGERIADLCAAPGGKTAQLAASGARVTAVERDPRRLARLRENLARLRLEAECIEADAAEWTPPAPFDAVLLDAPCTATGTIRRHPDVPHLKRPRDVVAAAAAQGRLAAAAARMLRPGGRLIYAVCSLQPEEAVRAVAGLEPAPFGTIAGMEDARTAEGFFRSTPAMGVDGFFVGRFVAPGGPNGAPSG